MKANERSRISCSVYRDHLGDCTNNGVTSKKNAVILVWGKGELPECYKDRDDVLELRERRVQGTTYINATPLGEKRWTMFGGNFVYTNDSRFPSPYPIPVHDRIER